jgi:hypothetical protein
MIHSKLIQQVNDTVDEINSLTGYLKQVGCYHESEMFELRSSGCVGELLSLLTMEKNRLSNLMEKNFKSIFPTQIEAGMEFKSMSDKIERKICSCEVKSFDDSDLTVTHFISTQNRDRGGDSLDPDGMVIEGRPVVLMSHGFGSHGQEPIAKPIEIRVGEHHSLRGVIARTKFYDGSHLVPPDNTGRRLYEKCKGGYLVNWSIGWIPLKWTDRRGPSGESWRDVKRWLLLEYSPVGVGMNPEAMTFDDKQVFQSLQFKIMSTRRSSNRISDPDQIKQVVQDLVTQGVHEQFRKLRG